MKKILSYIMLCGVLLSGSCAKDDGIAQGEGAVSFRIALSGSESRAYDPVQKLLIRIYNQNGGLVRRYTSLDALPENLYLVAGNYTISVDAGDKSTATWTNKTYHGEKTFTIKANEAVTEQVSCPSLNVGAQVSYDQTVAAKFDKGAYVYVSANNTFELSQINDVPTLKYDYSEQALVGYFLLPEGVTNLSWGFYGSSTELGDVKQTGTIENAESATVYKLKFQYSKTPDGSVSISVLVDKSTEDHFDNIIFSPQPTLKGDGFAISETVGYNNNPIRFVVSSVKKLSQIVMKSGDKTYTVFDLNQTPEPQTGVSYEQIDEKNLKVVLSPEFFAQYTTGIYPLEFEMLDADNGEGKGSAKFAIPGMLPAQIDMWTNTGTFKVIVTDPAITDVKFALRTTGGQWKDIATVKDQNLTYTAKAEPGWIAVPSGNNTAYRIDNSTGIYANRSYEYKLMMNGTDSGSAIPFATAVDQTIPDGGFENGSLSCFTSSNGSAAFWASGNNTFTPSLCTQSTYNGMADSYCVKMQAGAAAGVLASGNLFTGIFYKDGLTTGVVEFGQPYEWKARPTAVKLKYYAATLGKVDISMHSGAPIGNGDQDKARIFVAIIDWNTRHKVASGTSAPTGVWDPATVTSTGEGKIIAYASMFIEQPSTGGQMIDVELPMNFYDKITKPTGKYTLIISAATSAYGDYMVGCKSNTVYVDDFQWVY